MKSSVAAHRPATAMPATPRKRGFGALKRLSRRPEAGALVGTLAVYVFFVVAAGHVFVTLPATATWMNTAAEIGIVAVPIALLLIAGEFDLSIGSVIGASSMVVALGVGHYHAPVGIVIVLALAMGALVGLINGLVLTWTGLPSFVVTLATNLGVSGLALGFSTMIVGTTNATIFPPAGVKHLFATQWGEFHVAILWWFGIAALAAWVMAKTRFGNWILATGGDRSAAMTSGVRVARVKITLFVTTGFSAALLGAIQAILYGQGDATRGQGFIFDCIIAAVVGGVLLGGGYGSALGVVFGAATYGIVSGGVFYTGWPTVWVQAFLGALLLIAVLANNSFRRLALAASEEDDE